MSIVDNLLNPRYRLSKLFFYVLVFLLPLQTRKLFFTSKSLYFSYFSFYNSFFLYLTDLVFLCIVLAWLWESAKGGSRENSKKSTIYRKIINRVSQDPVYRVLFAFWLILATSLIFSRENSLGLYGLAKVTEYFLLFVYVRENFSNARVFSRENHVFFWLILATFSLQAILGITQYLSQSSFGLKLLGEEYLRPGIPGVAEFVSSGVANPIFYRFFPYLSPISDGVSVNIRAYGTLPHPNVLAGLLFAGLMVNLLVLYVSREKLEKLAASLSLFLITTGLVVTFSRFAWLVAGLGIVAWFGLIFWKIRRPERAGMQSGNLDAAGRQYSPGDLALIAGVLLLSFGFNLYFFGNQIKDRLGIGLVRQNYIQEESFVNREVFNDIALRMIKQNPILGVGLKNFVVAMDEYAAGKLLPYLHQPAHNLYLLIAAESGILALLIFLFLLYNIMRLAMRNVSDAAMRYCLLTTVLGLLLIGFFDHYLWTIQQGSLMLWMVLGVLVINKTA